MVSGWRSTSEYVNKHPKTLSIWKPFSFYSHLFLETLVVLAVVIRGPQHQHVELFRVATGTVAPWRGAPLLVAPLVRFLVMPMMLVMFAATVPQPSGATLSRIVSTAAAAKVARLEVRRRARDRRLDRVVRIVPATRRARVAALQNEAKVVPLVVKAGQLLVKVVRQRQAERHLAAGSAGGALRRGWGRDDRERRRRRQAVQLPVGLGSAAAAGADLAVPVP